jgi:hypothetical protein
MPAKTKRKTTSLPRSTVTKSSNFRSTSVNKKRLIIVITVFAVIGVFLMFRASAATTNFEAENATRNALVSSPVADSSASGGQYVSFSQPTTTTTTNSTQRFPGDPNPKVNAKAYIGADQLEGTTYATRFEQPTGKSMSTVRRFYAWGSNDNMANTAKSDLAANRLPMYSIKTPGWADVAAGKYDAQLDDLLRKLDAAGGPVWLIVYHEPDGGGGSAAGPKNEDDPGGAPAWVAMQKKVRARMTTLGTKNIALMAAMTGGFGGDFHQPKDAWWADNTFDAFLLDLYVNTFSSPMADHPYWKGFYQWAEKKGIPYGTAELGQRAGGAEGVGYYQPTSDCNKLTPRGLSDATVQQSAKQLETFWNWGFTNKKDVIAHAYFDKCVNSGSSPWALGGQQLTLWQDILKNDARVMRVNELNKNSTTSTSATNYGKITNSVTLPESGYYKVWVRMKAADATNNSAQLQVDNGIVSTVGGSNLNTTTWTWVSLPAMSLGSGTRNISIIGTQKGVKIDRVIVTNETCIPSGTGDLCATITPPPTVTPGVTISGITSGQIISGVVPVTVTSNGSIEEVSFRPDNVWDTTISTAPFTYKWDTTKYPNGTHTLVSRTRFVGNPGGTYTLSSITVTIKNEVSSPTTPNPAVDAIAPTKPTSFRATLVFDWSKFKYVMNLKWDASYDNVGVTGYQVSRGSKVLGTSKTNSFVDSSNLNGGATYTYSVLATDSSGNKSPSTSIILTTECILISCRANIK